MSEIYLADGLGAAVAGRTILHARKDAQFSYRHAKLPTGPTHSEQGDTGIDRFGLFAELTRLRRPVDYNVIHWLTG
jgi:hypothetical protein